LFPQRDRWHNVELSNGLWCPRQPGRLTGRAGADQARVHRLNEKFAAAISRQRVLFSNCRITLFVLRSINFQTSFPEPNFSASQAHFAFHYSWAEFLTSCPKPGREGRKARNFMSWATASNGHQTAL